jgi:hypothetical protein
VFLLPVVGRDQIGATARAIDCDFAFGAAVHRADFFTFGRTIPFGASSVADRTNRFFWHEGLLPENVLCASIRPGRSARRESVQPMRTAARAQAAREILPGRLPHTTALARSSCGRMLRFPVGSYLSDSGSERFFGECWLSKETNFWPEGGTETAPSRTICLAVTFFP